ncbi:uncharacterized protein METZ01_LOCUS264177, partial [marine metagenome]
MPLFKTPWQQVDIVSGVFFYIYGVNMKVEKDAVVSMHYTLKNDAG